MHKPACMPFLALTRSGLVLLVVISGLYPSLPQASAALGDFSVYADKLDASWANWSWNTTFTQSSTAYVHGGSFSMAATLTAAWAGLYLGTNSALPAGDYAGVRFWIHGGANGGQSLTFKVIDSGGTEYPIALSPPIGAWAQITVTLTALGNPGSIAGLVWQDAAGHAQPTFYLDDITLLTSSPPSPGLGPFLNVDATADQHPISRYIYGMSYADETLAADLHLPVRRWGGNATSRYNWQNDTTNTGSDWYFENVPANPGADAFVAQDRRTETKTLLTMPLIGWVAKRRLNTHPYDCGFKITKYGPQADADWNWDPDCGNGVRAGGANVTGNSPADTSTAITESFASGWVSHLVSNYGTAQEGGVQFYNLDNEPMLWNSTHRDVHPDPTTYAEMNTRTMAYAAAIKGADPSAQTLGPVVWGWCAYFFSAKDGCSAGADRAAHGNVDFIPWYLQQLHAYEQQQGVRLLDYLDVHIYPQIDGVFSDSPGSASVQAARLRSTRQLWDPAYVHEGWIGQPVYLIPRMRSWVADNYPGTKLAITEYNWGALGSLNGALAEADLLGIFGREGLDLATLWGPPTASQPGAYAFRMYLNYDGAHGHFGETSVRAASTRQDQLAIYGARRASDDALTLMIINKTGTPLTSTVDLSHFVPARTVQVFRYSGSNLQAIVRQPDQTLDATSFTTVYPANSITLVVVPPGLAVSKAVSPAKNVGYGQVVTYTLVISGDGRTALLVDPLPVGLTYVPGSLSAISPPAVYISATHSITWAGTIPSGGFSLVFQAQPTGGPNGSLAPALRNTATLTDTASGQAEWATAVFNGYQLFLPTTMR
jgi:uncharacterized repeat protein (TIGR01451 family)